MKLRQKLLTSWAPPLAAITLIWVALFVYLGDKRSRLLEDGITTTANLAQAFEQSLAGTIREVDETLLFVRALRGQEGNSIDLQPWIKSADPENRLAAQIATADKNGIVTLSNLSIPGKRVDLSDRPHFRHFADNPRDDLYISVPVLGRVSMTWTIQFVRMLKTAAGEFDGIIVLSVPTEYLVRLYDAVNVGKDGRISMIGLDGVIRARAGGSAVVGQVAAGPVIEMARKANNGHFEWTDPTDGIARIGSFRRVAGYPFVVVVEMSKRELLAEANQGVPRDLAVASLLTLVVLLLAISAIRQRTQAESAYKLTKLALDHVGVGIMVVNPSGRISMFNARAQTMLGLPPPITPGTDYDQLLEWQRRNGELTSDHMAPEVLRAKFSTRPWSNVPPVFRRTMPDGRIIETRTEALENGMTVSSFSDITAADQAQRTLTEARDAAETAVRARAQFFAAMSHEIRTPLNGILGVNELLGGTPLSDEQKDYVNIIQQAGTHLLEMLTEILDYSKIDQVGVELDMVPFDPAEVVRAVTSILRPIAVAHDLPLDITIKEGVPLQVMGDPHRVRQVLLNLISNAIKFTPAGQVDVTLGANAASDGSWWLEFAVQDTGIGIEPQSLSTLFQEFTQTDGSISRRFGGTGLGLAICRRVVEAMGGAITVDSTSGKGSLFRFTVPVGAATDLTDEMTTRRTSADVASLVMERSPTVLLVEDNRVNRLVARRMLERSGCKVISADNGVDGVKAVSEGGIDVVLMDVMMPEMDGLAATRAIRAMPAPINGIPIIGLSSNAFRSDYADGRAAGMNSFLTKPIDTARLLAEIAAILNITGTPAPPDKPKASPLRHLREMLGEDATEAVIKAFCDDAPRMMVRLRKHVVANSATGVAQEAHALAGSAGALELMSLCEDARAMEQAARRSGTVPEETTIAALEKQVDAAIFALRAEPVQ